METQLPLRAYTQNTRSLPILPIGIVQKQSQQPADATYVLHQPPDYKINGLLYYQGDSQLHYTTGTNNGGIDAANKVKFYLGQTFQAHVTAHHQAAAKTSQTSLRVFLKTLEMQLPQD